MNVEYKELFSRGDKGYSVLESKFYEVDYLKHTVREVDFEDMFIEYLFSSQHVMYKKFMLSYIRLCMNTIGINFDYILTPKDLDAIMELFFTQGHELVSEDEN